MQMNVNNSLPILPSNRVWTDLGISRSSGRRLLNAGLLQAVHLRGRLYITRDSLDRLMERTLQGEVGSPHLHKRGRKRRLEPVSSTSSTEPAPAPRLAV